MERCVWSLHVRCDYPFGKQSWLGRPACMYMVWVVLGYVYVGMCISRLRDVKHGVALAGGCSYLLEKLASLAGCSVELCMGRGETYECVMIWYMFT